MKEKQKKRRKEKKKEKKVRSKKIFILKFLAHCGSRTRDRRGLGACFSPLEPLRLSVTKKEHI
jgi:hypothetical protein